MQLEQRSRTTEADWSGTIPNAFDGRIVGVVVVLAGLAASLNVPYGGLSLGVAAFVLLLTGGVIGHVLGERQLRRLTDGLVAHWSAAGGTVDGVTRSANGMRTEWTVHTSVGDVTVGGIALVPIARLSVEYQGVGDSVDASDAEANFDTIADELYEEIFEFGASARGR
ncbi:hypothetical protein [Natrarchaeobaculum sulfurireducens]|uniref:Uncharacterized protein n=1 Tax=Natrarchaeobaculum sulfurireducens TaxID=2044521 RepID=A0A346PT83_9EURY|nr:hypothetical protein [Natrarchaeobaculum sulfurireducens]AXR82728.1 hypothetical protein AArcMg_2738 [Natrarchaeobaculum sulfurireducens]